jgi:hypothetical protein
VRGGIFKSLKSKIKSVENQKFFIWHLFLKIVVLILKNVVQNHCTSVLLFCNHKIECMINVAFNDPLLESSDIREKILEMIDDAKKEINIAMYYFTDNEILSRLERQAMNGCVVRVAYSNEDAEYDILDNYFKNVENFKIKKISFQGGIMHHKMMMVDRKYLMFGSYNFTNSANNNNYESVVFISNTDNHFKDVVTRFLIHYQKLFDEDLNIAKQIIIEQEPVIFPCIKSERDKIKVIKNKIKNNTVFLVKGISLYVEWKVYNAYQFEILINNKLMDANVYYDNEKASFVFTPISDADLEILFIAFDGEIISYKYTIITNSVNELFTSANASNDFSFFIKNYKDKLDQLHNKVCLNINKITDEFVKNRQNSSNQNFNSIVKCDVNWYNVMG